MDTPFMNGELARRARRQADQRLGATGDQLRVRLRQAADDLAAWGDAYAEALREQATEIGLREQAANLAARAPLTATEAAAALNCSSRHIFNLCERGTLRRVPRVGQLLLVVREDVERLQRGEAPVGVPVDGVADAA